MHISLITDDPTRTAANALFARNLRVGHHAAPLESQLMELTSTVPQLPLPLLFGMWKESSLIGAGLVQAQFHMYSRIALKLGDGPALKVMKRWRLISHLTIEPHHRGSGHGGALLEAIEVGARESGALGLFGFAEDSPSPSWPFYETSGYSTFDDSKTFPALSGIHVTSDLNRSGRWFLKRL